MSGPSDSVAVLVSGGLDSATLLADLAGQYEQVHPLYIQAGLAWESVELTHLRRFLNEIARPAIQPLVVLSQPVRDLYGEHWSINGRNVPDERSADEAVYLPGRNMLLLTKALLWCHLHSVKHIALALLKSNPFPDATGEFFELLERTANVALKGNIRILCPYASLTKTEVLQRGHDLPLQWTFSCIHPIDGRHCGTCNKCAERRKAFADAGWPDPTAYQN